MNNNNNDNNDKQTDIKKVSKTMSWILRHGINELSLKIDEIGRIPLQILLEQKQIRVATSNRFSSN